ncbi:MAG: DUF2752 domain-containing protein [Clostridiales bacterium]|nr:DUF2752 domain-containing protein [Clostridiales bacterium]
MHKTYGKLIIYHLILLLILLLILFVYRCPIFYFFHVPCAGCGITRAYFSAFSFNLKEAFRYHPLFFTVAPTILYIAHRNILKKRLSNKAEKIYFIVLCSLFLAVYIIRVYKQLI